MVNLFDLLTPQHKPTRHKPTQPMHVFNAFQIVAFFAAMPFLIGWLNADPFPFSIAAFWLAIVVYLVLFGILVSSTAAAIKRSV